MKHAGRWVACLVIEGDTKRRVERTPAPYPKSVALGPREGLLAVPGCKNVVENLVGWLTVILTPPSLFGSAMSGLQYEKVSRVLYQAGGDELIKDGVDLLGTRHKAY